MRIFYSGDYGIEAAMIFRKWILSVNGIEEVDFIVKENEIRMAYLFDDVGIEWLWYNKPSKDIGPTSVIIQGDKKEVIDDICNNIEETFSRLKRIITN